MLIRAGYEIEFEVPEPVEILTQLNVLPEYLSRLQSPDLLRATIDGGKPVPMEGFIDRFGTLNQRLHCPAGRLKLYNDFVIADSGQPIPWPEQAEQPEVSEIPDPLLVFLMPSRYCESDKLGTVAWNLFGNTPRGWPRVKAVTDWVHNNVTFGYQYASNTKTAEDVFQSRQGVCRDFSHLCISFCRALNIPARYATGYLGDIGVPANPAPMDFSACFEVFLGGRWWLLDARHNVPRIGWVLMSRGRDAADCAITTAFGSATLIKFQVWTDEVTSANTAPAPRRSASSSPRCDGALA